MDTTGKHLAGILSRNWWVLLLRGLKSIAFGTLLWLQPGISLKWLFLLFGSYVLVDGIIGVWMAVVGSEGIEHNGELLIWGLLDIGIGILTFVKQNTTAIVLMFYIATWAVVQGVLEIVAAIRLRRELKGEWLILLGGIMTVAFGGTLMAWPTGSALAVLGFVGAYGIIFGMLLIVLALRVRTFDKQLERM
jgi:uncharacterized membrane protein HdeD (DUF308 family)